MKGFFVVVFGVSYAIASAQAAVSKPDDGDWPYVDRDLAGTRHSPLKQITAQNVSRLAKVCAYTFPDKEPSQTAPIVSAGTIYLTTARYTVAVDGSDCHAIWTSKWSPRDYETSNANRGAALGSGKIIRRHRIRNTRTALSLAAKRTSIHGQPHVDGSLRSTLPLGRRSGATTPPNR